MFRKFAFVLAAVAVTAFCSVSMAAGEKPAKDPNQQGGVVVKVDSGKLTLSQGHGDKKVDNVLDLATDVKVTINGKDGKVEDLKAGDHVKVTLNADKKVTAIAKVESKPKTP